MTVMMQVLVIQLFCVQAADGACREGNPAGQGG